MRDQNTRLGYLVTQVQAVGDESTQQPNFRKIFETREKVAGMTSLGLIASKELAVDICGGISFETLQR